MSLNGIQEGETIEVTGNEKSKYLVKELLGRGAMANVHLVKDTYGNTYAMKSLLGTVHKEEVVRRHLREAAALATLDHPNIVMLHDLGWDKKRFYLVLENLSDKSGSSPNNFSALLNQFHKQKIDMNTMLHYFKDICNGLDYLHTRPVPIIHRDLKPANILVSQEEIFDKGSKRQLIKLADFGLAKITSGSFTTLTDFGQFMGTPEYAPIPDLLSENHIINEKSDLYSVGIMLYSLLTGGLPFSGKSSSGAETPNNVLDTPDMKNTPDATSDEVNRFSLLIERYTNKEEPELSPEILKPYIPEQMRKPLISLTKKLLATDQSLRPSSAGAVSKILENIAMLPFRTTLPSLSIPQSA